MKRNAKVAAERLKKVILSDKVAHSDKLNELLISDVTELLSNYFELYPSTVTVKISKSDNSLNVMIAANASRVKPYGNFSGE